MKLSLTVSRVDLIGHAIADYLRHRAERIRSNAEIMYHKKADKQNALQTARIFDSLAEEFSEMTIEVKP